MLQKGLSSACAVDNKAIGIRWPQKRTLALRQTMELNTEYLAVCDSVADYDIWASSILISLAYSLKSRADLFTELHSWYSLELIVWLCFYSCRSCQLTNQRCCKSGSSNTKGLNQLVILDNFEKIIKNLVLPVLKITWPKKFIWRGHFVFPEYREKKMATKVVQNVELSNDCSCHFDSDSRKMRQ